MHCKQSDACLDLPTIRMPLHKSERFEAYKDVMYTVVSREF